MRWRGVSQPRIIFARFAPIYLPLSPRSVPGKFPGIAGSPLAVAYEQIIQGFNADRFLAYLNGESEFGREQRAYAEKWSGRLNDFKAARAERYPAADDCLITSLRDLVDDWLDSAINANGSEEPGKRELVHETMRATSTGTKISDTVKYSDAYLTAAKFLESHPIEARLGPAGEIWGVFPTSTHPTSGKHDPVAEAKEQATRLFVLFMDSELRWRLAKCRNPKCPNRRDGAYYYYSQRKLNEIYQGGTHCSTCRSRVTAQNSNEKLREPWRESVLLFAAEGWPKWKQEYGPRSPWLAMQVNERLSKDDERITGKWITQNDEAILRKVKELRHAKG